MRNIDININREKLDVSQMQQVLREAIKETYQKFRTQVGEQGAQEQIFFAMEHYIRTGITIGFTRQGNARGNISRYVRKEDMLDLLVNKYVEECCQRQDMPEDILGNSLRQTLSKYNALQAQGALKEYILSGNTQRFYKTRKCKRKY